MLKEKRDPEDQKTWPNQSTHTYCAQVIFFFKINYVYTIQINSFSICIHMPIANNNIYTMVYALYLICKRILHLYADIQAPTPIMLYIRTAPMFLIAISHPGRALSPPPPPADPHHVLTLMTFHHFCRSPIN